MLIKRIFIGNRKDRFRGIRPLVLIAVIALIADSVGQETPKAVLVDEHGMLPCDDNLGRIDTWYAELSNNPRSVGLVVITTPPEKKHLGVFRELMMKAHAKFRGVADALVFRYVRVNSGSDFKVQLWRIPPGGNEPEIEKIDMSLLLPKHIDPFILGTEYKFGDQICPEISDEPVFADFLKANSDARGNIVVRDRTIGNARAKSARILRNFQNRYGISRHRLRVFPATLTKPSNHDEPVIEYWYLP